MTTYLLVKYVHVTTVVLSLTGFFLRGILMMRESPLLGARWIKVLPHVNDTVLLAAALSMAAMSGQYPFVVDWVTAKVLGVIAYIILGALALRDASTRQMRVVCWLASMAVFGWIVSVALSRQAAGFFAPLLQAAGY
ncbi:MAG: SirB2 family protein [Sulfuritalea sp.]|nr:SirB2 family protein [Sulfuritalea sp.]